MKHVRSLTFLIAFGLFTTACAPVMVGSHYYRSGKDANLVAQFNNDLRAMNLEREKNGLEPLDFCEEVLKQSIRIQKQILKGGGCEK